LRKWGHFPEQQNYIKKEVLGSKKNFSDKKCDKLHFFGDKMQFIHTIAWIKHKRLFLIPIEGTNQIHLISD